MSNDKPKPLFALDHQTLAHVKKATTAKPASKPVSKSSSPKSGK